MNLSIIKSGAILMTALLGVAIVNAFVPEWWVEQNVLPGDVDQTDPAVIQDNYKPAVIGQAKHMAYQAYLAMEANQAGSAGADIETMALSFSTDPADNYSPLLIGQLKAIAQPFYDRFSELNYTPGDIVLYANSYPWDPTGAMSDNYKPANLGQLKYIFSFDLTSFPFSGFIDTDGDGLSDDFEQQIIDADLNDGIDSLDDVLPGDDFDGDGLSNQEEFDRGSDPTNPYDPNAITTLQSSPADGETDVAVTRETILRFSNPLDPSNVVDNTVVFAEFGGQELSARIQVAADLDTISLFYDEPLPPSARVRVTVNGDQLLDAFGRPIDADGDNIPGGTATIDFDTLTLTLVPGTSICGRVFASELAQMNGAGEWVNEPIEGATISVDGAEDTLFAVTDALGDFRLDPAPAGKFFVHIDGSTATNGVPVGAYYPNVGKAYTSVPGQETTVGDIFLPLVIDGTLQTVSETEDTSIEFPPLVLAENPEFAGVSITVPAGSLFANDGTSGGSVGIAPVDPDRLPGTLPDELNFPLVITVQTDGATNFDEPAPICFPNLPDPDTGELLGPGEKTGLWSFNHDAARWEVVGPMTVSADGTLVCSDPGVGILAPGWHGTGPGTPSAGGDGDVNDNPEVPAPSHKKPVNENSDGDDSDDGDCGKTNPVLQYSGEKYEQAVDLRIKGVGMDFVWARSYSSKIQPVTVQGHGWDFNYNIFLIQDGSGLRFCNGAGRDDIYRPVAGETNKWARNGFFQQIELDENNVYRVVKADKSVVEFYLFDGSPQEGKIARKVDRNGNEIQFFYDAQGRLNEVVDTLGRSIDIAYNIDGFIESITDFIGRSVTYEYYQNGDADGSFGDLKSVTSPTVTGTPTGNDFPNGKTTTYTYSKGFGDERLNHNLLTITDGRRNDPNDPTFGEGPYLVNVYSATLDPENLNYDRVIRQIRGGDIVDLHYVSQEPSAENNNATILVILNDRVGNVSEYFYDLGNRLVLMREYTGRADPALVTTETQNRPANKLRVDDPDFYQTRYEYNANYLLTRITYPNGTITENVYESDLNPAANPRMQGNLRIKRRLPGGHTPAGDQTVIEEFFEYDSNFGCGSCGFQFVTRHTDGRGNDTLSTYDTRGNRLTRTHRIASIVEEWEYNSRGQVTKITRPDNGSGSRREDVFTYYESGPQFGYLQQEIIDQPNLALTTTYEYDLVGNLIRRTDPRGHDMQYVINTLDQVVRKISREVNDGSGIRYEQDLYYDANNNIVRTDVHNIDDQGALQPNTHFTTTYEYEILNYLIRKTEEVDLAHSIVTEYAYDGNRNQTLIRYGEAVNGNQPTNTLIQLYDERDLLFRTVRAEGDAAQSTTQYNYDGNRNIVQILVGLENTPRIQSYFYDGYNRLVGMSDPMGNVAAYQYDANSNQVVEQSLGELIDVEGSAQNLRLNEVANVYDVMDRLIRTEAEYFDTETQAPLDDGKSTMQWFYSDSSQVIQILDDGLDAINIVYDTVNRRKVMTDAKSNTLTYEYDKNNNITKIVEVEKSDLGAPDETFQTVIAYDNLDRQISLHDDLINTTLFAYDSRNNLTRQEDPRNNLTYQEYDGLNRLTQTRQILTDTGTGSGTPISEIVTQQVWDDNSRLQKLIDDNGNETTWAYDALNRQIEKIYDDNTLHSTVYDVHDNPLTYTDANGSVCDMTYDLLNRLIQKDITLGTDIIGTTAQSFQYDGLGRIKQTIDSIGADDVVVSYRYNSLNRVVEEIQDGKTILNQYNSEGVRTNCTYPNGLSLTYNLDSLDRIERIDSGSDMYATYDYIGPSRIEQLARGNGVSEIRSYSPVRRMTAHAYSLNTTVLYQANYQYDPSYNRVMEQIGAKGKAFFVDSVNRLEQAKYGLPDASAEVASPGFQSFGLAQDWSMDGLDNFLERSQDDGVTVSTDTFTINNLNQYDAINGALRTYDANGNLIQTTDGVIYRYDFANRLKEVEMPGQQKLVFTYDLQGRRLYKAVYSWSGTDWLLDKAEQTVRDGWLDIEVYNATNDTLINTFIRGVDMGGGVGGLIAEIRSGPVVDHPDGLNNGTFYIHGNYRGDIIQITDAGGSLVSAYDYDVYGNVLDNMGPFQSRFRFSSKEYDDETSLHYYGYRYYESEFGRWLNRDPIEENGGINLYGFVKNNSVSKWDYLGLYTLEDARNSLKNDGRKKPEGSSKVGQGPGRDRPVYTDEQIFDEWLRLERKDIEKNGGFWNNIPKCPEELECGVVGSGRNRREIWLSPDENVWSNVVSVGKNGQGDSISREILKKYHPGATSEIRTGSDVSPSGNQCTYDSDGMLMKNYPAAGSADKYGPNSGFFDHQDHDVKTYNLADKLNRVDDYYSVRPVW